MLFKDLKVGYPVYILHKEDSLVINQGKVTAITPPRFPQVGSMQTMQMVVDITIDENGVSKTYTIPDSLSVTYADALVISTDKEGILREVESIKAQDEEDLSKVPDKQRRVEQCSSILTEWNPVYKEKRENEARFTKIESAIGDLKGMLSGLIKELKE